jgi:hypothetical protein
LGTSKATGKSANNSPTEINGLPPPGLLSLAFAVKTFRQEFGVSGGSCRLVPFQNFPAAILSPLFGIFATHLGIAIIACSSPSRLKKETT